MEIKLGCIRDPIHDYIYFTLPSDKEEIAEKNIIDNPWVQRLRRILQLQSTWMVYPGATHTRFQHVMGVMHLAGQMAYDLYDQFKESFPDEPIPEKNFVEEILRLAGLLHDIGHGPMGHLLDDIYTYPKFRKTHEDISAKIIETELSDLIRRIKFSPHGAFHKEITPDQLMKFIKMPSSFDGYELWEQLFSKIMLGVYSVDIIDFLLKEFGSVDIIRLLHDTRITPQGFALNKDSIHAFKGFLYTRYNLFRHIYFYAKKDLFEISFAQYLPNIMKLMGIGDIFKHLSRYMYLDDFSLNSQMLQWAQKEKGEKRKVGKIWENILISRNCPLAQIAEGEKVYNSFVRKEELPTGDEIRNYLQSRIKFKCPITVNIHVMDIRFQNQFLKFHSAEELRKTDNPKILSLFDPGTQNILDENINELLEEIPVKYLSWQAFVPGKLRERAAFFLKEEENVLDSQLALPLPGLKWNEKKERTEITNA